ncbi:MAG: hypothetical protein RL701_3691 [Pseudomonadota bacterium]
MSHRGHRRADASGARGIEQVQPALRKRLRTPRELPNRKCDPRGSDVTHAPDIRDRDGARELDVGRHEQKRHRDPEDRFAEQCNSILHEARIVRPLGVLLDHSPNAGRGYVLRVRAPRSASMPSYSSVTSQSCRRRESLPAGRSRTGLVWCCRDGRRETASPCHPRLHA